jgi:hypothetical protein
MGTLSMTGFQKYIFHLDELINTHDRKSYGLNPSIIHHHLNGAANEALLEHVSPHTIKESGAFFTGELLGRRTIECAAKELNKIPVLDPACGAGDLLLRWAECLPVQPKLEDTIEHWGTLLYGFDLHPEFISATKRRLILSAISRGARLAVRKIDVESTFPNIKRDNFLAIKNFYDGPRSIILNPPFNQQIPAQVVSWSKGKVSQAALFFIKSLAESKESDRIIAILPDVLRSGSRYEKWRTLVSEMLKPIRVESIGRFSASADIDVFILDGRVTKNKLNHIDWAQSKKSNRATLDTICDIRIGTVVPHRDPEEGKSVRYFTAPDLPPWETVSKAQFRNVGSTTFFPPLVAVRRTSSPSDRDRPVASIISGKSPIALENHLIALLPHDGSIETCNQILEILRSPKTRLDLDKNIRCRHLTVGALKKIKI